MLQSPGVFMKIFNSRRIFSDLKRKNIGRLVQSSISCFDYKWWPDPSVMRWEPQQIIPLLLIILHLLFRSVNICLLISFKHILALWLGIFRIRRGTHQGWPGVWSRFDWDEYDWASATNKKWSVVFWKNDRQLPWWAQQKPEWWCLDH